MLETYFCKVQYCKANVVIIVRPSLQVPGWHWQQTSAPATSARRRRQVTCTAAGACLEITCSRQGHRMDECCCCQRSGLQLRDECLHERWRWYGQQFVVWPVMAQLTVADSETHCHISDCIIYNLQGWQLRRASNVIDCMVPDYIYMKLSIADLRGATLTYQSWKRRYTCSHFCVIMYLALCKNVPVVRCVVVAVYTLVCAWICKL